MSVEELKRNSRRLRGSIAESLQSEASHLSDDDAGLLKFHGSYQQDDRDQRKERLKQKQERAYSFMVRSKIPSGAITAEQYLVHDRVAEQYGNGALRITSRQGFQTHFILKGNLKDCIQTINESGITTWGACGDVVRNVMGTPVPIDTPAYRDMRRLAVELKDVFASHSNAYSEIWLDGEKLDLGQGLEEEPVYGDVYLPRKFKIGIAIPPRNDVDIYSQDIGLVPHEENGEVMGYTVIVGGGFGMSHGKDYTYPVLGKPLFFVDRNGVVDACVAIVTTQRDFGNREDRKRARMKYLIEERGLDWFRNEVRSRMASDSKVSEAKSLRWETTGDPLGWHEQGDGKLFCCVWVPEGRIRDEARGRYRSGFSEIANRFGFPVRLTPNCNIIFHDIDPTQKEEMNTLLAEYGIPQHSELTEARRMGMACVALPTCGLALAESERVFQELLDEIDKHLSELGLREEPILFRMTGCPNGCARPYNADFAFVGKSPGKYVLFVGGSHRGDRLAGLEKKMAAFEELPALIREYLEEYVKDRLPGETFSDYWGRARVNGDAPRPEQFHDEGWRS